MNLINNGLIKFDRSLPIYNWYYPMFNKTVAGLDPKYPQKVFDRLDASSLDGRALYFHIPFCKSICTFCPFERSAIQSDQIIEQYVRALIHEIQLKAKYSYVSDVPVIAIFMGGGTPSVLEPHQIQRIGEAIHDNFNLSKLREFSVEMTAATSTEEKLSAFQAIGVTHARFGIQTFNTRYRKFFNLSTNLDAMREFAKMLSLYFPHISFDMLYGMNGQTDEEFVSDIQQAIAVGVSNIDYYPINNVVTQPILHKIFEGEGLPPTSGLRKFHMNILLREYMLAGGFAPHNGHGFVKVSDTSLKVLNDKAVTNDYTFWYHKYVYGYRDAEVLGFGTNAISTLNRYTMRNIESWEKYINNLLNFNTLEFLVGEHDTVFDESKGVILHLPYHGKVEKKLINWDAVHPDSLSALRRLVDASLVLEHPASFELTVQGWYWYVNLLYYLSPKEEQSILDRFIADHCASAVRHIESVEMPLLKN